MMLQTLLFLTTLFTSLELSAQAKASVQETCLAEENHDFRHEHGDAQDYDLMEADSHAYESFLRSIVACGDSDTPENCQLAEDDALHEKYKKACEAKGGLFHEPGIQFFYCSSTWRKFNIVAQQQIQNFGYCYPQSKHCNKAIEEDNHDFSKAGGVCKNLQCPYCRDAFVSDCSEYLEQFPHYKPSLAKEMEGMLAAKTAFNEAECWIPENYAQQCLADTHHMLKESSRIKSAKDQLDGVVMQVLQNCKGEGSDTCTISNPNLANAAANLKQICETEDAQWFSLPSNHITCSVYNSSQWQTESQYDFQSHNLGFCLSKTNACKSASNMASTTTCDNDMVISELTSFLRPWKSSSFLCHVSSDTLKGCPGTAHAGAQPSKNSKERGNGSNWFKILMFIVLGFFILLCAVNEQFRLTIVYSIKDYCRGNY